MNFFEHTESWFKGEAFEGGMLAIFGALLVVLALYFWKVGHSPTSRALVIPFLVVGLLISVGGGVGLVRNSFRVETFRAEYKIYLGDSFHHFFTHTLRHAFNGA